MAIASYRFFPWVRSGLAAILPDEAPAGRRAIASVKLAITPEVARSRDVELLGPGDVAGIDTRFIVRTDPRPGSPAVEPNYMASIEFDRPDFPWMLTPRGAAVDSGRLEPWLVLVVVDRQRVGDPLIRRGSPLPMLQLKDGAVADELPDLADSWAWAHAQRLSLGEPDDAAELEHNPDANVSRLLCPRRLAPNRRWLACVVPAFDIGVAAGLGLPPQGNDLAKPAWTADTDEITLPIYFHWTFDTAADGDFEKLASLLTPNKAARENLPAETARQARAYLGAADGSDALLAALPAGQASSNVRIDAVLETLDRDIGTTSDLSDAICDSLESATAPLDAAADAVLGPPLNGSRIVERENAQREHMSQRWFDELNLDPRTRVAARTGADAVRSVQEELMQAAWEQVGNVLDANAQLDRSRFFAAVAERALQRHVVKLPPERQLAFFSPAYARTRVGEGSARGLIRRTSLPDRAFDAALRRISSPTSRLSRTVARLNAWAAPAAGSPFTNLAATLQRSEDQVDPGRRERDGATSFAFARALLDRDGSNASIAIPGGEAIKASAIAEVPENAGSRLTLRDDLADGVLSDRNRLEILGLAEKSGLAPQTIEKAARKAAPRTAAESILVLHRAGGQLRADPIVHGTNGEVSLLEAAGPKVLFTLESDTAPDPLTLARLAFKVPDNVQPGRNLTVLLRREGHTRTASFAETSLDNLGGGTLIERLKRRRKAIFDAHHGAGVHAEAVDADSTVVGTLSAPLRGPEVADAVRKAFDKALGGLTDPSEPKLVAFDLDAGPHSPLTEISTAIQPARSFRERLGAMVTVPDWIADRLDIFEPVRAAPDFQAALSTFLAKSDPNAFVPRDIVLPANSVSALKTNARWEAAAMVGANHEINRELVWRTYPTDGRGTSLRRFWQWLDPERDDIAAIAGWPQNGRLSERLGSGAGNLVFAIRGTLLQRYPNTIIFVWKAAGEESLAAVPADPAARNTVIRDAQFRQFVDPDLTLAGFDLSPAEFLEGWFLVLQEPISESRFGLDEAGTPGGGGRNVNDRNWQETDVTPGGHLGAEFFGPAATAATIANTLLQRPVRVAIHSSLLAPAVG